MKTVEQEWFTPDEKLPPKREPVLGVRLNRRGAPTFAVVEMIWHSNTTTLWSVVGEREGTFELVMWAFLRLPADTEIAEAAETI